MYFRPCPQGSPGLSGLQIPPCARHQGGAKVARAFCFLDQDCGTKSFPRQAKPLGCGSTLGMVLFCGFFVLAATAESAHQETRPQSHSPFPSKRRGRCLSSIFARHVSKSEGTQKRRSLPHSCALNGVTLRNVPKPHAWWRHPPPATERGRIRGIPGATTGNTMEFRVRSHG